MIEGKISDIVLNIVSSYLVVHTYLILVKLFFCPRILKKKKNLSLSKGTVFAQK